jgi:hypothetical protein
MFTGSLRPAQRKHGLLALVLAGYALMAMLIVEQDRTIGQQRNLIHSLFSDSRQLTALKMKQLADSHR